jgi:hypothetical protein
VIDARVALRGEGMLGHWINHGILLSLQHIGEVLFVRTGGKYPQLQQLHKIRRRHLSTNGPEMFEDRFRIRITARPGANQDQALHFLRVAQGKFLRNSAPHRNTGNPR